MKNFINRIHTEQTQYLADIAQLPPNEIIAKAYEICYRNEFVCILESTRFDDETMAVFMNTPNILDVLYDEWLKTDASVCDMLEDVIRDFAESEVEKMKGLQGKNEFRREYTFAQMELLQRLAEIEQEDEDRCANCGGEDCICCEYYHDRQKWKSPKELFEDDPFANWHED